LLRRCNLCGYRFRRQVPVAGYILDFYCMSAALAVEADGGQHNNETAREYDRRRTGVLLNKGIRVIRFSDFDILKNPDAVVETIYRELSGEPPP
jgi:very-short-patch-repair endonuclease